MQIDCEIADLYRESKLIFLDKKSYWRSISKDPDISLDPWGRCSKHRANILRTQTMSGEYDSLTFHEFVKKYDEFVTSKVVLDKNFVEFSTKG